MNLAPAALEDWLRDRYFTAEIDISSSGVECFSMAEVRQLLGISVKDLDAITFRDSPSLGDPLLRQAIAERWGDGNPDQVMATNGSSEALFLLLSALLKPGDEVVALEPAYHSLAALAEGLGCNVRRIPLRFERGFVLDLDEVDAAVSPRTRMVIVNFPHNPTGATVDHLGQHRLLQAADRVGAYLVWDAAFVELSYGLDASLDLLPSYELGISVGTLSKAYGLPGLRVGWCLAAPKVLADCIRVRDYTTLALSPLVELVAHRAVQQADVLLSPRFAQARRNLELLDVWIRRRPEQVTWVRPGGGVTGFPLLRHVTDVEVFCQTLLRRQGVLLVPGTCFAQPGHVRLGFGGPTAELEEGLLRMERLLDEEAAASTRACRESASRRREGR